MKKTTRIFWKSGLSVIILLFGATFAQAQDDSKVFNLFSRFSEAFDGYITNETAMRIDDEEGGSFTKIYNRLQLEYTNWLTERMKLSAVLRAVYDAVYDVEDDFLPENKDDYHAYVELREAVVNLAFETIDINLGKQQVVWGKTDGLRVLDIVNPLDLKDVASTEFLDQRIPLWMGNIEYYFNTDFSLQALIIPDMEFSKIPEPSFPADAVVRATEEPATSFENTRYGVRFSGFVGGWDFTLNYLYSWDSIPVFRKTLDTATGKFTISPEYERLHIVGGSCANVFWNTVFRGEIAASFDKYLAVSDLAVPEMMLQKDVLDYALAFERDSFDIHWIGQVLQSAVLNYDDSVTTDEFQTYLTLQGAKDFRNDTVELTVFLIYHTNEGRCIVRPDIEWDVTDAFAVTLGANLNEEGTGREDRVYVEVKYSF